MRGRLSRAAALACASVDTNACDGARSGPLAFDARIVCGRLSKAAACACASHDPDDGAEVRRGAPIAALVARIMGTSSRCDFISGSLLRLSDAIIPLQSRCQRHKSLFPIVSELKCRNCPAMGYELPQDLAEQLCSQQEANQGLNRESRRVTKEGPGYPGPGTCEERRSTVSFRSSSAQPA
jgi:hypothetical protein